MDERPNAKIVGEIIMFVEPNRTILNLNEIRDSMLGKHLIVCHHHQHHHGSPSRFRQEQWFVLPGGGEPFVMSLFPIQFTSSARCFIYFHNRVRGAVFDMILCLSVPICAFLSLVPISDISSNFFHMHLFVPIFAKYTNLYMSMLIRCNLCQCITI